jgi:hypothetical protein
VTDAGAAPGPGPSDAPVPRGGREPAPPKPGVEGLKAIADLAKQIISLGSALLGLTVTFADKFRPAGPSGAALSPPPELLIAWGCYIAATVFAILILMGVAGSLNEIDRTEREEDPRRGHLKGWGILLLLSFGAGLGFTAAAGHSAIG